MAVYLVIFLRRSWWCGEEVHLDGDRVVAGAGSDFDEASFGYVDDAVGEVVEVVELAYLVGFVGIVQVGDKPVLGVFEDVGLERRWFLGGVHHPDVELGTFFSYSCPDIAIIVFAGSG